MKLITETFEDIHYVTEAKEDGKKSHFIEGIFLQGELKNRNGRVYPIEVLDKEVGRYTTEMINTGRAVGELGHPAGPTINLDRVSHIITELKKSGNDYVGKAKLTETPFGNIAKGLLESGVKFGVSSRGLGSLKEDNGVMKVQSDYRIATAADIVHDPSAPRAFVEGIMEGVDWIYDPVTNTWMEQKLEDIKSSVHKMNKRQLEEQVLAIFEDYISSLLVK